VRATSPHSTNSATVHGDRPKPVSMRRGASQHIMTNQPITDRRSPELWENDFLQALRFLDELRGLEMTDSQIEELCESMDMTIEQLDALWSRLSDRWDKFKDESRTKAFFAGLLVDGNDVGLPDDPETVMATLVGGPLAIRRHPDAHTNPYSVSLEIKVHRQGLTVTALSPSWGEANSDIEEIGHIDLSLADLVAGCHEAGAIGASNLACLEVWDPNTEIDDPDSVYDDLRV